MSIPNTEKLRRTLLRLDIAILNTETTYAKVSERVRHLQSIGKLDKRYRTSLQKAKIKGRLYQSYLENLLNIKKASLQKLDDLLNDYLKQEKEIFVMFFLQQKAVVDIATIMDKSPDEVQSIIVKLNNDINGKLSESTE